MPVGNARDMRRCSHRDHGTQYGNVVGRADLHDGLWEPCPVEQRRAAIIGRIPEGNDPSTDPVQIDSRQMVTP